MGERLAGYGRTKFSENVIFVEAEHHPSEVFQSSEKTVPGGLEAPPFQASPQEKGKEVEAVPASLERRNLQRNHDSWLHVSNQGDCVVDIFIPAPLSPGRISSLLPRLQIFVGP